GPRELLDDHVNARMRALELGHQRGDDFAFAAHGPEAHGRDAGRRPIACGKKARRRDERERRKLAAREPTAHFAEAVSQPPENPARSRPRRTYVLPRMTFQMRPLR